MPAGPRAAASSPPLSAVALISAAALAYEILLTRVFAIVHWHHLVATAISIALLGYGASGTFVTLLRERLERHFAAAFIVNALLFALTAVGCVAVAQGLPLDPQALAWEPRQVMYLAATFLVLAVPFFAAANCVALALTRFKQDIPRLYGADLLGAAAGSLVLLLALARFSAAEVLIGIGVTGLLVAVTTAVTLRWHPRTVGVLALILAGGAWFWARPDIAPAPYKDLARTLAVMGAQVETVVDGVAGQLTLVSNDRVPLRTAPGMSLHSEYLPPRQLAVFHDGDAAGALADFSDTDSMNYLDQLVSALPYRLLTEPAVAVLNAGVGGALHQALHQGAARVLAVEPNPQLYALRCRVYPTGNAGVCDPRRVSWRLQAPRTLLDGSGGERFDLIVLEVPTDTSGLDSLDIDFDITLEALQTYLGHLSDEGLLAVEGPSRMPPRLSLKMIASARDALRDRGIAEPGQHIAVIRGWQRFLVLAGVRPIGPAAQARIREFTGSRGFDLVWLPGIRPGDANRFQQLSRPAFYLGAANLLDADRDDAGAPDRFRLQAATDDRPFPHLFTQWAELNALLSHDDPAALGQADTGLLIAVVTLPMVVLSGVVLILLPLLWIDRGTKAAVPGRRWRTLLYFSALGFAFLFIEIAWIQRLQQFLGHPVYATGAVLAAFLMFAGLGSLWTQHRPPKTARRLLAAASLAILLFCLLYVLFVPAWLSALGGLPLAGRIAIVFLLLAPLAFAMGIPFPLGLRTLGGEAPALVPWAWGINGCVSVVAAVGVPLLAVDIGFSGLTLVAGMAYVLLPAIGLVRPVPVPCQPR